MNNFICFVLSREVPFDLLISASQFQILLLCRFLSARPALSAEMGTFGILEFVQ